MTEVAIDAVLHHRKVFDLGQPAMDDTLRSAVVALFEELNHSGEDYLLVGGVALLSYVAARNTEDVDLIVDPTMATAFPWNAHLADHDFGQASYRGIRVDLLLTTNALFAEVQQKERTFIEFAGQSIPCVSREGLLLLKLYALPSLYRQGKLARAALYETDILMLHQDITVDDDALLARLGPYLPAHDLRELEKILSEQRSRRRFGQ